MITLLFTKIRRERAVVFRGVQLQLIAHEKINFFISIDAAIHYLIAQIFQILIAINEISLKTHEKNCC